jgi:hypothetical protein
LLSARGATNPIILCCISAVERFDDFLGVNGREMNSSMTKVNLGLWIAYSRREMGYVSMMFMSTAIIHRENLRKSSIKCRAVVTCVGRGNSKAVFGHRYTHTDEIKLLIQGHIMNVQNVLGIIHATCLKP